MASFFPPPLASTEDVVQEYLKKSKMKFNPVTRQYEKIGGDAGGSSASAAAKVPENISTDWIFRTGIFLLTSYWLNISYWNVLMSRMFLTGISLQTEHLCWYIPTGWFCVYWNVRTLVLLRTNSIVSRPQYHIFAGYIDFIGSRPQYHIFFVCNYS